MKRKFTGNTRLFLCISGAIIALLGLASVAQALALLVFHQPLI